MNLRYDIKEEYDGNYTLTASANRVEYKRNIPKRKVKKKKFIQKLKEEIEQEHQHYLDIQHITCLVMAHSEDIEQPKHFLEGYDNPIRFNISKGKGFLILVEQKYKQDLTINIYFEKYNQRTTFWDKEKIESIVVTKKYKKDKLINHIETILKREWEVLLNTHKIKNSIEEVLQEMNMSMELVEPDNWRMHTVNNNGGLRDLVRFKIKETNQQFVLIIKGEDPFFNGRYNSEFILFEEKKVRYNIIDCYKWTSGNYLGSLDDLLKEVPKTIKSAFQHQIEKEKTKDFISNAIHN